MRYFRQHEDMTLEEITIDEVWPKKPQEEKPPYPIPGPYEIAMAFGAALASTGRYETPGAAMAAAWFAVPEFYQARDAYIRDIAPLFYGASPAEGTEEPEPQNPETFGADDI